MPNLMKDRYYNYITIHELAMCVNAVYPTFPADDFIADVMDKTWNTFSPIIIFLLIRKITFVAILWHV